MGLILLCSTTCDKDATELILEYAAVNGWIHARQDSTRAWHCYREGIVAGHPAPLAESTWVLLSVNIFYDTLAYQGPELPIPGALLYADSVPLLHNLDYRFSVASNIGACLGEAPMPDSFAIFEPAPGTNYEFDQDITFMWTEAPRADWYSVEVLLHPYNPDSGWFGARDTLYAIESSTTVLRSAFLQESLATYIGVDLFVVAHGGPMPGEEANLDGDIEGYFVASLEPWTNRITVHVGTPPVGIAAPVPRRERSAVRLRTLLGF
jgi:hypothetical protein